MGKRPAAGQHDALSRRRLLNVASTARISSSALGRVLGVLQNSNDDGASDKAIANSVERKTRDEYKNLLLRLCTTVAVPKIDGSKLRVPVAKLAPLVNYYANRSAFFARLMRQAMQRRPGQPLRMILYHDEVVPGQVLAPDNRRKTVMFYASFLEFQQALRCKSMWMTIALVRDDDVQKVCGGLSAVVRALLAAMCLPANSQLTGPGELLQFSNEVYILQVNVNNLLADEAALKGEFSTKGASGMKPCMKCLNVVSKASGASRVDSFFVDIAEDNYRKFIPLTCNDAWYAVDELEAKSSELTRDEFEKLQTHLGFTYNPHGLLASRDLRLYAQPRMARYDYMHVYLSNGIAGWEMGLCWGALKEHVKAKGGRLQDNSLEAYAMAGWKWPRQCRMSKAQVASAMSGGRFGDASFKGMASEVLAVFPMLLHFVNEFADTLGKELESIRALGMVLMELQAIKFCQGIPDTSRLLDLQAQHLRSFVAAYGPEYVRPKHHFAFHLKKQIDDDGMLLDCFPLEAKHAHFKSRVAPHLMRLDTFMHSALPRLIDQQCCDLRDTNTVENRLIGPVVSDPCVADELSVQTVKVAKSMVWQPMQISSDDVVFVGSDNLMKVTACLEVDGVLHLLGDLCSVESCFYCFGNGSSIGFGNSCFSSRLGSMKHL